MSEDSNDRMHSMERALDALMLEVIQLRREVERVQRSMKSHRQAVTFGTQSDLVKLNELRGTNGPTLPRRYQ